MMAEVFKDDPVIRYMTSSLSQAEHEAYLRPYFRTLWKAALLNDATFQEANDWSCCAVWMPPGKHVDNWLTIIPAGFIGSVVRLGVGGGKVSWLP